MDIFKPIELFANFVVYNVFNIKQHSHLGDSLQFFIYDTIKIFILILIISFTVGYIKSFFTHENTKKNLMGLPLGVGNILAALLGIVTPFCSCSACPLFIGFVESGIPLGVTFSYLISAPMINEVALILLWGLFGIKVALIYIISGLFVAIFGGLIIGELKLERFVEPFVYQVKNASNTCSCNLNQDSITNKERLKEAKSSALEIFKKVYLYIIIGVGIGALIHGFVPTGLLVKYAGAQNPFAVPIAVIIGVPLYANIAGVLPITEVLVKQGLPIGTVLAFTMAVTALSFPEMIILRKILKPQLLAIFIAILIIAIVCTGYLFNFLL
ncbi:MAG: permease [Candidatus Gastranaerophilales bacterium]|nr:permease [Candidatus Gastranaerophilales bacterium]